MTSKLKEGKSIREKITFEAIAIMRSLMMVTWVREIVVEVIKSSQRLGVPIVARQVKKPTCL